MLLLILHWICCGWYVVVMDGSTWDPPKDVDNEVTVLYTGSGVVQYNLLFYYAVLTLVGNELLPSNYFEVGIAALIILM